jgi:tRNA A37 threonylcarbamoyladenosine synthetase subunit TsaC/SUA5/YrdC
MIEEYTDPELMYENFKNQVDIVVNGGIGGFTPSTIIDCTNDTFELVRQGAGEWNY